MTRRTHDHEERLRVICHLPVNGPLQVEVADNFVAYLQTIRETASEMGVDGFTHSQLLPAGFRGYWWSEKQRRWVPDRISVFLIDYRAASQAEVSKQVLALKQKLADLYRESTNKQEEVWVVAHSVIRQE